MSHVQMDPLNIQIDPKQGILQSREYKTGIQIKHLLTINNVF